MPTQGHALAQPSPPTPTALCCRHLVLRRSHNLPASAARPLPDACEKFPPLSTAGFRCHRIIGNSTGVPRVPLSSVRPGPWPGSCCDPAYGDAIARWSSFSFLVKISHCANRNRIAPEEPNTSSVLYSPSRSVLRNVWGFHCRAVSSTLETETSSPSRRTQMEYPLR